MDLMKQGKMQEKIAVLEKKGMNVRKALLYAGNSEEFLEEELGIVAEMLPGMFSEIQTACETGDDKGLMIKLHSLKNNLLTVGFEELGERAKSLELAIKEAGNNDLTTEEVTLLLEQCRDLVALF